MFAVKWFKVLANQKQGFPKADMFLPDREYFVKYQSCHFVFVSVFRCDDQNVNMYHDGRSVMT